MPYRVRGTYLESCNCDAICPCRRIDARAGARSTHGICEGALSWAIEKGEAGSVDLAALGVLVCVDSGGLGFEYRGVCAYESTFDYEGQV